MKRWEQLTFFLVIFRGVKWDAGELFILKVARSQLWYKKNPEFKLNMNGKGIEMGLEDSAAFGRKTPSSPSSQHTNYDSLKELNANNGKRIITCNWEMYVKFLLY